MGRAKGFSREGVLDKTIPVFWRHGFAETSVQEIERVTGVRKSGLYTEFENKDDLFTASMQRYLEVLATPGILEKQPLGWTNVEQFLKLCRGGWGQRGCFAVNSMRELSDLPPQARELMIGNVRTIKRQLIRNLAAVRGNKAEANEVLAGLVLTFFSGICLEQNFNPTDGQVTEKIARFMQLISYM